MMTATEQESLTELFALVDQLFGQHGSEGHCRYRLGRTRTGWQFDMADDARRWESLSLKWRFRGKTPQRAIRAFLDCIQHNGISVARLSAPSISRFDHFY